VLRSVPGAPRFFPRARVDDSNPRRLRKATDAATDIETVNLGDPVDTVISSLTFKHLFPSFEYALRNIAEQLCPEGLVVFDLIEGHRRYFEDDGVTYICWYSRDEVSSAPVAMNSSNT
jgi:hypothetical protein